MVGVSFSADPSGPLSRLIKLKETIEVHPLVLWVQH